MATHPAQDRLNGKVAVITGAASGIGKQIALLFAEQGAKVVILDMDKDAATQVAEEIERKGGSAMGVAANVTDEEQVDSAFAETVATFGRIDVMIANAGSQHVEPIHKLSFENWKKVTDIQLDGSFLCTRAAFRQMMKQDDGGCLIYMGSAHSHEASAMKSPYVTAKHGLLGLCRTMAKEGAQYGIRSNVICPGYVKTPLVEKQIPDQAREHNMTEEEVVEKVFLKETVDQTFTTVEDVAETALYLVTFPSTALTGQSIMVSHGWYMQ
ncbi:3-hydroxybutyrate dehydrogenase [Larsenimonas suaedae]|uniref:3-hydroxybutyrate dehydrogenase n=1 Tax=Larsenimonas suaedae TaxID=1851019 RepID=A0ABU1GZ02_9GAMM|nr:3-hydroxybutyrate dehydrogenase [Larsenimonas suaedae]MCM2973560.1 3-hydroxybutyrate dehydrogenase [Larsenimonas suaedae]MDR5897070.1 3-hydroxybutyrate dehydrogenase [Larsenimonas suaedae]